MWKRTNALRRLFRRTKNNIDLRESKRVYYTTTKTILSSSHEKEKQYLGKKAALQHHRRIHGMGYTKSPRESRQKATMTTLQKPERTITADIYKRLQ